MYVLCTILNQTNSKHYVIGLGYSFIQFLDSKSFNTSGSGTGV
jgi:hypothetical protein